ncbi:thioredoxin [Pandoraea iniqua]|uniref:Thioredoxin n=2 Tax=Pandoraea iniqua TaxID=2508288 RepID=A0A5E4SFQ2_9BURK|nr:thioredoxin [Pandoraea iniqua]VVD74477.1 thioredoxin [Pandoraea iniqua]
MPEPGIIGAMKHGSDTLATTPATPARILRRVGSAALVVAAMLSVSPVLASATATAPSKSTATTATAVTLPAATDFAAHARRAVALDAPLIVLVSLRDCVYCGPIRQRELAPLVRSGKYEVREIGMDSAAPVRDFDGTTTTGIAWARAHGVKVSPTVLFLDTNGRAIADPLIGAGLPDFYGAYLDDAIANARARLHAASGTTTR